METPALFSTGRLQPEKVADAPTVDSGEATVVRKGAGSDDEKGVQEILELLCVLGAAHKRLCQVRACELLNVRVITVCPQTFSFAVSMQRSIANLSSLATGTVSHWLGTSSGWTRLF